MTGIDGFRSALSEFQRQVEAKAIDLHKRVIAEAFTGLVQANPVGNPSLWKRPARRGYVGGTSRRAWQLELNGGIGGPSLAALGAVKMGDRVRVLNDVPYMDALNKGHSKQAPPGWIDAVVQRVLAEFPRGAA